MTGRTLPLLALALGILTLIAFGWLGGQPAVSSVYSLSEIGPAVSAFQRAEEPQHIVAVFGYPADPDRIAAMNALNRVDLMAFIPAYALFLSAAAIMLGGVHNRWTQAAIAFALIGAFADAAETWKQLQLTADMGNIEAHLPIAPWHWLKYAALGLNGVAISSLCITGEKKRWILAVIALLPLPLIAGAYVDLLDPRIFAQAMRLYWVALLVVAAIGSIRGKGA